MSSVGDLDSGPSTPWTDPGALAHASRARAATLATPRPSAVAGSSRPHLGSRSVSSPFASHLSGGVSMPSIASPRRGLGDVISSSWHARQDSEGPSSPADGRGRREWTVFGQLMENDELFNEYRSLRMKKRSSRRTIRDSVFASEHTDNSVLETADPKTISTVFASPTHEQMSLNIPDYESSDSEHENDDSEHDSNSSRTTATPRPTESPSGKTSGWQFFHFPPFPPMPVLYKNIIKCAVAYFIASLFTYIPVLSHFIGSITSEGERTPSPSGHMVATVAVYFNPAKTHGAMFEADLYCFLGVLWASFISLGSMGMYWWLEVKQGWEWLADILVLIWIGLGMSAVAFMKVWMSKPSFNTACSMTTIVLFVVIVREGGLDTLLEASFIILVGAAVSNLVCHILWPQSAAVNLKQNMTRTLDSFATLLATLTNTFLLGDSSALHQPSQGKLQRAVDGHQTSFTSLKKNLAEARSEWVCGGPRLPGSGHSDTEGTAAGAYEDAVDSMNRLAQHLNGLRSGTRLQHDLAKAHREGRIELRKKRKNGKGQQDGYDMPSLGKQRGRQMEDAMKGERITSERSRSTINEESATLQAAAAIFGDLVDDLGPPLSSLTQSCTTALRHLRDALEESSGSALSDLYESENLFRLSDDVQRALFSFESTSNQAVMRMYRRSDMISTLENSVSIASSSAFAEDEPLTRSGVDETLFLTYFFIFTLQEFAKELTSLIDAMGRVYAIELAGASFRGNMKRRLTSMCGCFGRRKKRGLAMSGAGIDEERPGIRRRLSTFLRERTRTKPVVFPKVRPHAPNTLQTPSSSELTLWGRFKQWVWRVGGILKGRTVKFAFKAGMATALLASPAFFDATRPLFLEYRGEWALISFFVVISPTIGATNFLSLHRVIGTIIGASTAIGIFSLFPEDPVALSIFGFFFSIPCFYYIVATPQYASSGRFVLLTYNLTCLYCYNVRQNDVPVLEIGYRRALSVIIGVVYAFLVSHLWWPAEARRELGNALSEFCLDVGWLYTHLVASYSGVPISNNSTSMLAEAQRVVNGANNAEANGYFQLPSGELSNLLPQTPAERLNSSVLNFMAMELHLQIKLIEMQGLLAQTAHEPRLKGPFPVAMYRQILTSLQTVLDRLHSMRCVTTREEWFTNVRRDFILPVNVERREMVGNVILYFSVLSAAFKLKVPLPPYLPPAEQSRQRLVSAITRLEAMKHQDVKRSQQLLYFAYALMMKGVIQELDYLGRTLQGAFGVIGSTTIDFESLFIGNPGEMLA